MKSTKNETRKIVSSPKNSKKIESLNIMEPLTRSYKNINKGKKLR